MTTIKDAALTFEPKTTKNITELEKVPVALEIQTEEGVDANGEAYTYSYIELNDNRYRIPNSVVSTLKKILVKKPNLEYFAVTKDGEGRNTRYTVIPLD